MSPTPGTSPDLGRPRLLGGGQAGRSIRPGNVPGFSVQLALRIGRDKCRSNVPLGDPRVLGQHYVLRLFGRQIGARDGSGSGAAAADDTFVTARGIPADHWVALAAGQSFQPGETRNVLTA